MNRRIGVCLTAALLAIPTLGSGFDMSRHGVPVDQIVSGGPRKDGIPALHAPRLVDAAGATFLHPSDRVIGVSIGAAARVYPINILNWHEAVNDTLGGEPIVVTYCPLTDSAVVFDRRVNGQLYEFRVSGLLYESNVLLYDRQTESLWSQLAGQAVTGEMNGAGMRSLASAVTSWADWQRAHPHTTVVSFDTGYRRDYAYDSYEDYRLEAEPIFPVSRSDKRLPDKERVLGLRLGEESRAYPLAQLARVGRIEETVSGTAVTVTYDRASDRASVTDAASGRQIPATTVYWFAWAAFYPKTSLWSSGVASTADRTKLPRGGP